MRGLTPTFILLLVFTAGYAVQRGSICAVAAVDALVRERRLERFLAFFLCAAVALAVMAAAVAGGVELLGHYRGSRVILMPLVGGALFGAGAWINGRCAFGTIAGLGAGELARLGTLAGLFAGFGLAGLVHLQGPVLTMNSPLEALPASAVFAGALGIVAVLVLLSRRRPATQAEAGWPPLAAMGLIGLVNGVLLVLAAGWPYTNLLMDLARSTNMDLVWRTIMALTFVAGALAAAITAGAFRIDAGTARQWGRCVGGGVLMGLGATLVPGGNDTMLLVGLPLLLPNLVFAYLAMMAVMAAIAVPFRPRAQPAPV